MSDMTVRYLTGMSYTPVRYLTVMSHAAAVLLAANKCNPEVQIVYHAGSHT